jgi:hypothetical protein
MMSMELLHRYALAGVIVLIAWVMLCLASISTYKQFFGVEVAAMWTTRKRVYLALVSFFLGVIAIMTRVPTAGMSNLDDVLGDELARHPVEVGQAILEIAARGFLVVLTIALTVKLYEKWVNRHLSDGERMTGTPGVRAWLSRSNVLVVVAIALCAWMGFDNSFWAVLCGGFALILAQPLLATLMQAPAAGEATTVAVADLSPERERVLRLLEAGKITAEESSELLSALAATVPPPIPAEPWTPARKLMAIGAALVLIGFFLPWYSFDPAKELRRAMNATQDQMRQFTGDANINFTPDPQAIPGGGQTVNFAGGDVKHGLGWLVLLLGACPAVIPYVVSGIRRETRRLLMTVSLAAGAIVALYLMTSNVSMVSYGLPLVLVGFVIEGIGLFRERESFAPAWNVRPVIAA